MRGASRGPRSHRHRSSSVPLGRPMAVGRSSRNPECSSSRLVRAYREMSDGLITHTYIPGQEGWYVPTERVNPGYIGGSFEAKPRSNGGESEGK